MTNGEMYAWGRNDEGQLGIGNTTDQIIPVKIEGITNLDEIYTGYNLYVKTTDGKMYAWGRNGEGQLGIGNTENQSAPVKIEGYGNTQKVNKFYISDGSLTIIDILTKDGKIYTWLSDMRPI